MKATHLLAASLIVLVASSATTFGQGWGGGRGRAAGTPQGQGAGWQQRQGGGAGFGLRQGRGPEIAAPGQRLRQHRAAVCPTAACPRACRAASCPSAASTQPACLAAGSRLSQSPDEQTDIRRLAASHASIHRSVEELPNGVRTTTTTTDPGLVAVLRRHVRDMQARVEQNRPVRLWDPAHAALFEHAGEIAVKTTDLPEGIEVTATSDDPAAAAAIQTHARKVTEFAERGPDAIAPPWAGRHRR